MKDTDDDNGFHVLNRGKVFGLGVLLTSYRVGVWAVTEGTGVPALGERAVTGRSESLGSPCSITEHEQSEHAHTWKCVAITSHLRTAGVQFMQSM